MQVFGLPGQIIKNGRAASRLLAAQTPNIEAARRRDAVARWLRARADGLNAEQAARAVGVPRSTLYRWEKDGAAASSRAAEDIDARLAAGGGAAAPGLSHVGPRQDRPAPARRRLPGLRRHRRAHARRIRFENRAALV